MSKYVTVPVESKRLPRGIPYIIGNEMAERFSFYGMKGILTVFMTKHLMDSAGQPAFMSEEDAKSAYHLFTAAAYFFPIIGSLLADIFWGKYKTIIVLSLGYCVGHACLAVMDLAPITGLFDMKPWLFIGLMFIAVGAGGIKPCVSAHVGDQFGKGNQHLVSKIFSWFYFAINVGAMASTLMTPLLLEHVGPWAAFGLPGVLMAIATFVFWLGRKQFIHVPAAGWKNFKAETLSPDGLRAVMNLAPIFLIFIPMFWALFDQTGSAWVIQANYMDREFMGVNWLESQVQAVNPLLILILIPTFAYLLYPFVGKFVRVTPLRKIGVGLFLTAVAFSLSAWIESQISGGKIDGVSSVKSGEEWLGQSLIDGPADGFGWSTSDKSKKAHEITLELREYRAWKVNAVELDPYTIVGDDSDRHDEPDIAAWAKGVTVFVRNAEEGETKEDYREVGTITLKQERGLQTLTFDETTATHVKIRIDSNWGAAYSKLGQVRVLTTEAASAMAEEHLSGEFPDVVALGFTPNIAWQFLAYLLLTAAEVMVSITALEFAYTQAPKKMKSFIMGIYFLGVSLGNLFTAAVNYFIQNDDGTVALAGADYYWFFTILMAITAVLFIFVARLYKGKRYVQGDDEAGPPMCDRCGHVLTNDDLDGSCPECGAPLPTDEALESEAQSEGIGNV